MNNIKNIDAQQLKDWLESNEAILVDVREPNEFNDWRIPQAISMPLTNIDAHLPNLDGEKRKVVFQCLKGKRGETAAKAAVEKFGDTIDVYNLTGGIEAWGVAGLEITRGNEKSDISITRQVQIAAGGLVVFFSLLALMGLKFGALMAMLVGGGLLFSGLTGTCALAIQLKKMPWNNK